ncbi:hypothetical protein SAMN05421737_10852 [Shouchella lonarensis]|uniref:DhaL domain-containing protein n=1 Tax=Shouchella lonarensis TaxID=1464122 RepID=A0A1G6L9V6_9BACI|nr:hypothetical protein SAMN05421737_10852 [Shouchella lonarensis]
MTRKLDGKALALMFVEGGKSLADRVDVVDSLNVFPVPDGDTGTNMNLTMTSGVKEVQMHMKADVGSVAGAFAKGLLMGARGNSGVILSQLFRGFSQSVKGSEELTTKQFAEAIDAGVQTAYQAVMKPVEGTILTVAKDTAKHAQQVAKKETAFVPFMKSLIQAAEKSLKRTPELLPVLKEVGVVDSGGQGLVYIYGGFLQALTGERTEMTVSEPDMSDLIKIEHHHMQNAHSHIATEEIEFGYCTEVMVKFDEEKLTSSPYDEEAFRTELSKIGDSLLVVSDDDLLKVHIHAEYPGEVITAAQSYGPLVQVKIENMRAQHENLVSRGTEDHAAPTHQPEQKPLAELAIVTVSMGEGIEKLFKGLGASEVIAGGQTMNPSTEDIVEAIKRAHAHHVLVLPNNGNIVMAAEQAAEMSDVDVAVVPTKTVPQGLAALLAFNPAKTLAENAEGMKAALAEVKTGELTYAVRDTYIDEQKIEKGDFMGIFNKKIVSSSKALMTSTKSLLLAMIDDDSEMLTVISGADAKTEDTEAIVAFVEETFPEVEMDVVEGGQPLYSYIFSVE